MCEVRDHKTGKQSPDPRDFKCRIGALDMEQLLQKSGLLLLAEVLVSKMTQAFFKMPA